MIYKLVPVEEGSDSIRAEAERRGSHWFEPDTKRFFRSRVGTWAELGKDGRYYFVSSEKAPRCERKYSVRAFNPADESRCPIDTAGEFQAYETSAQAHSAIRKLSA